MCILQTRTKCKGGTPMDLFNKQKSGVSGGNIGLSTDQMTLFCNLSAKLFFLSQSKLLIEFH